MKFDKLNESVLTAMSADIEVIREHELKTVDLLGAIMPAVLSHVHGNANPDMLNNLIGALSPANRKTALVFFDFYQAHKYVVDPEDARKRIFGKRDKGLKKAKEAEAVKFFSVDPNTDEVNPDEGYFNGDYWLWVEEKVKVKTTDVDYMALLKQAMKNARDESKGGYSADDIFKALLADESDLNLESIVDAVKLDKDLEVELAEVA